MSLSRHQYPLLLEYALQKVFIYWWFLHISIFISFKYCSQSQNPLSDMKYIISHWIIIYNSDENHQQYGHVYIYIFCIFLVLYASLCLGMSQTLREDIGGDKEWLRWYWFSDTEKQPRHSFNTGSLKADPKMILDI